jgi:hypothetical protein
MKHVSFVKATFLVLALLAGTAATARTAAGLMSGWCGAHTRCNCLYNYGDCGWCVTDASYSGASNEMPVTITITADNTLLVTYERALTSADDATLDIEDVVTLPQSICTELGVSSVAIQPGSYTPVFTADNPNGVIVLTAVIN